MTKAMTNPRMVQNLAKMSQVMRVSRDLEIVVQMNPRASRALKVLKVMKGNRDLKVTKVPKGLRVLKVTKVTKVPKGPRAAKVTKAPRVLKVTKVTKVPRGIRARRVLRVIRVPRMEIPGTMRATQAMMNLMETLMGIIAPKVNRDRMFLMAPIRAISARPYKI